MQPGLLQLLGMILAFGVIIVLVMRRFNYGLALIFGSLLLGIFCGFSLNDFAQVLLATLADPNTYELVLVIALIPILAYCMTETGMMDRLLRSLKDLSGKSVLAMVPAIFGLLPMMGGALLSAPVINSEAEKMGLRADVKSFINVWFRHCMFFVNPLNPSIILTSCLSYISLFDLILVQIPICIIYVSTGYLFSVFSIKPCNKEVKSAGFPRIAPLLKNISPLLLVFLLIALGFPLALALVIGICFVLVFMRVGYENVLLLIRRGFDWRLVFAIFGIMLFHHVIEASGAVNAIVSVIGYAEVYPLLFLILFSCFAGVATAAPTIAITVVLPMALQMLGHLTPIVVSMLYLTMYFSYLVSPMHLCLILTVEYYKARLQDVYRLLIPSASFVCLTGLILAYGLLLRL